jgi:hypothetical protein
MGLFRLKSLTTSDGSIRSDLCFFSLQYASSEVVSLLCRTGLTGQGPCTYGCGIITKMDGYTLEHYLLTNYSSFHLPSNSPSLFFNSICLVSKHSRGHSLNYYWSLLGSHLRICTGVPSPVSTGQLRHRSPSSRCTTIGSLHLIRSQIHAAGGLNNSSNLATSSSISGVIPLFLNLQTFLSLDEGLLSHLGQVTGLE